MSPRVRPFWKPPEIWLTWSLLAALLVTAIAAVEAAHWINDPLPLKAMALVGLLIGLILASLPVPAWAGLFAGLSGGLLLTFWQTAALLRGGDFEQRFVQVTLRVNAWAYAARTGGINNDGLVFSAAMIGLVLLLSIFAAWVMLRYESIWIAVTAPTFFLLISLSWSPPELGGYFYVYLFCLIVLVAQVHYSRMMREWRRRQARTLSFPVWSFLPVVFLIGLVVLSIAWIAPTGQVYDPASRLWTRISSPWQQVKNEFNRLFASLNPGAEGTSGSFGQSLAFRSTFKLTNTAVMAIRAPESHYWRTQVYDYYTGSGWLISEQMTLSPELQAKWMDHVPEYLERELVTQTVKVLVPQRGDLLFAAGDPRRALLPSQAKIFRVDPVEIRAFRQDDAAAARGADFAELAGQIRSANRSLADGQSEPLIADLQSGKIVETSAGALYLEEVNYNRGRIAWVNAVRVPQTPPDLLNLRSQEPLARGQEYQIVSAVSRATDAQLRTAGTAYPREIRERYLQLPGSVTPRVRALAEQITANAPTPFDKGAAIEEYLRHLTYEEQVPVPPPGQDGVDFFLFDSRRGYCDYFASAMVVLARSAGLPARLVSGFQPGDWDNEEGAYVVRELNAHSWVEVFFPEYGWQEFEPSSSRPLRQRGPPSESSFNPADEEIPAMFDEDFGFDEGDFDLTAFQPTGGTWFDRVYQFAAQRLVGNAALSQGLLWSAALMTLGLLLWRLWQAGLRRLAAVPRAYEQLCRLGVLLRRPRQPSQTPLEYGRVLVERLPVVARDIETIVHGYVRTTYGRSTPSAREQATVEESWRRIRAAIWRGAWRH